MRGQGREQNGALPTKLFFRIGEVADVVGVEAHVLRYWETEFRSVRPQKSARGQRVYSRRDVETLLRVKELLYEQGFTIAGARRKLRDGGVEPRDAGDPTSQQAPRMRSALLELRADIQNLLSELG
jgi:DNA-binding transcriptional MerR regulator